MQHRLKNEDENVVSYRSQYYSDVKYSFLKTNPDIFKYYRYIAIKYPIVKRFWYHEVKGHSFSMIPKASFLSWDRTDIMGHTFVL